MQEKYCGSSLSTAAQFLRQVSGFDPHADSHGEYAESGGEDVCLILSAALCFSAACSHDLCHEITHLFGCTFLHLARDVRVSAEREARIEVSEHTRYVFHVHAVLQCQGRECVPLRYNYDKPEKPRISRIFILFQTEKSSREVVIS